MDQLYVGIWGCVLFIVLIFKTPIAYAMGIVGTAGLLNVYELQTVLTFIPLEVYSLYLELHLRRAAAFPADGLSGIPRRPSRDSYDAARAWFGKVPGGLAVGTVYAAPSSAPAPGRVSRPARCSRRSRCPR